MAKLTVAGKALEAVADGMTVMIGAFLGVGTSEILVDALIDKGLEEYYHYRE